jgi:hypothetical protein
MKHLSNKQMPINNKIKNKINIKNKVKGENIQKKTFNKKEINIIKMKKNKNKKEVKKKPKEQPKKIIEKKVKNNKKTNISNIYLTNSNNSMTNFKFKKQCNKININIIPIQKICNEKKNKKKSKSNRELLLKKENIKKLCNKKSNNLFSYKLNEQELNSLKYELAIKIDKRTYFQYYFSLLKKKQLILFTFLPANDYNLLSLKLSLFISSFSLYFTINAFFFSDDTMHKIHEDKGSFNIIAQIPQILYSSLISVVINMILKILSLSEQNLLTLKQEKDIKSAIKKSKSIKSLILIKFIIFFILNNILLLFFWYFISCFCAVYTNTQIILIKDTFISFALSMTYPFGLNLLPGIFRIPALHAKNKNKSCLYRISGIISLI